MFLFSRLASCMISTPLARGDIEELSGRFLGESREGGFSVQGSIYKAAVLCYLRHHPVQPTQSQRVFRDA